MVDLDAMLGDLAEEALAPPAPRPELERRLWAYRRRHRRLRALAATAAVVAVALPALAVVRGGGGRDDLRVATDGSAVAPTTEIHDVGRPSPTTTNEQAPADGRLGQPYVTPSYQPGSGALASFRVDPAPSSVQPRLTEAEVLAAFDASEAAPRLYGCDYLTIVRFGLFSGNVANPPAPDRNPHRQPSGRGRTSLARGVRRDPTARRRSCPKSRCSSGRPGIDRRDG